METSILTPTQKYAAAGLFAMALHQSQINQTRPSGGFLSDEGETIADGVCASDDPHLWIHEKSGLLWPLLRFMEVDSQTWHGLQETAGSSAQARQHVGAFLKSLSEESNLETSELEDKELALSKVVDAMELTLRTTPDSSDDCTRSHEYERECLKKYSKYDVHSCFNLTTECENATQRTNFVVATDEDVLSGSGSVVLKNHAEEGTQPGYQKKMTVLYDLLSACLSEITESDEKCFPLEKFYDARHRVALRLLTTWLDIPWIKMEAMEILVASSLASATTDSTEEAGTGTKDPWDKWKRGGIIGAAALTGGTLMAITGGLAAPAIAQGFSALGISAAAGAAGSVTGSAVFAASFGAAGAGLTGSKMARRIGDIEEFEFKAVGKNHNQGRLAVGCLISGLVFEEDDFVRPWEGYNDNMERYALQWESKNLIAMTTAIQDWLTSKIAIHLMKQGAMTTVLGALVSALSLPATLLTVSDIIDSKWAVAIDRSDKAGKLLAEVLLQQLQGNRPVTLIGYSLGARVIFKCLQHLAETGARAAGLIERVVLLGAPVSIKDENWVDCRKMVAGRFVNAYSTNDWTLGIAFRASLLSQGLAGIQNVDVPGVENVDVTHIIEGHSAYLWTTRQILEQLELESYYPVFKASKSESFEEKALN